MTDRVKINVESEVDIFILEYRLKKFMQRYALDLPALLLVSRELATNILKYGLRGFIEIRLQKDGLIVVAEDIGKRRGGCFRKEATGGLGLGLEVVKKNTDRLKIEQKMDGGRRVEAVFMLLQREKRSFALQVGVASKPHYLEEESGDVCIYKKKEKKYFLVVADVLGHGRKACEVAGLIESCVRNLEEENIEKIYANLEKTVWNTRGCAIFIAVVSKSEIEYLNIGNIRAWFIFPNHTKKLAAIPGVVGRMPIKIKIFKEPVSLLHSTLVVCTDGIKKQFVPQPEMIWLKTLDPQSAARKIIREFSIKKDDASVMIVRGGT